MRIDGWEENLAAYLEWAARQDFAYGTMDCVCFASNAVLEITGIDPMQEGRGKYNNLKDGAVLIREYRGSYAGIMDEHFERISPAFAQRGDIVLIFENSAPVFGVVGSTGYAYFKGRGKALGLKFPRLCQLAWRIE